MGLLIAVGGSPKPTFPYDYYYGVEWDVTVSNPHPTRIGKMELHASLPLQSMMRRCVLNDDGTVNYYLNANDSTKRDTGADANLDGTDGMVEVELPDVYYRFEMDGQKRRALLSTVNLPGFSLWKKDYISAYEATVQRSTSKLSSVVNATADYRGGNNQADWDELSKTMLGKPATVISLTNFRQYARNRGENWNCNTYIAHKKMWWLFAVEYATFNCQEAFNAELTSEGYRQGGLGAGVTTLNSTKWNNFCGYCPVVPCGLTNSLGNHTGVVNYSMPEDYDTNIFVVSVPSYRGVENPFGHIWKWTDGCKCMIQSDADGGLAKFYTCDTPANYSSSGLDGYVYKGNLPRTEGYVKELMLGEEGEIVPVSVGAGSTTYFCDYYYTNIPASGTAERGVLFGGNAPYGASAGFVYAGTSYSATTATATIGSRLCFEPA